MKSKRKVLLMILDGWGIGGGDKEVDAIAAARTPNMDRLMKGVCAKLEASGEAVGLPDGQMGNSEVGHLNMGAGRVVYFGLPKINRAIEEGELKKNETLTNALKAAAAEGRKVHLMGLVSDGGVHSHLEHALKIAELAKELGVKKLHLHAFTDGRDTDPKSGKGFLEQVEEKLGEWGFGVASIVGRYYAMDRDKRWERIKMAYDLLVKGKGVKFDSVEEAMEASYKEGVTDEFVEPRIIKGQEAIVEEGDTVICFNFRTDRMRQLTEVMTQKDHQGMKKLDLKYLTMTKYDDQFEKVVVIFADENLQNTLGEVIAGAGLKQLRIAETEKYAHVTFFFSGGREEPFKGEEREMIDSPKVATYDLQPKMSADEVTNKLVALLGTRKYDFICLNFANGDMVGHTGDFEAAVKACEVLDEKIGQVVDVAKDNDYTVLITADHGNVELERNEDGSPNTAHTTNPVPLILIGEKNGELEDGRLCDVAPTICELMGLAVTEEMTGKNLWKN